MLNNVSGTCSHMSNRSICRNRWLCTHAPFTKLLLVKLSFTSHNVWNNMPSWPLLGYQGAIPHRNIFQGVQDVTVGWQMRDMFCENWKRPFMPRGTRAKIRRRILTGHFKNTICAPRNWLALEAPGHFSWHNQYFWNSSRGWYALFWPCASRHQAVFGCCFCCRKWDALDNE